MLKMNPLISSVFLSSFLIFISCHNPEHNSTMYSNKKYTEGFVESEDVKLHYLDWGGEGPVLILLSGLGDTPFLFDSLAQSLSEDFHMIGYSRRNHGKSKAVDERYDNATLVSDLRLLLDSLRIEKASLLGWSMGGNEITGFAALYPERVNRLIYFEAGYDLSDEEFKNLQNNIPVSYLPDSAVMQSLDKYREWFHRFWFGDIEWNGLLEANLQESVLMHDDGRFETIPDNNVFRATLTEAAKYRRRYDKVQAPSLVIYAKPFFYPANSLPATVQLYDSLEINIVSPWRTASRQRIQAELKHSVIVDAPYGSHTSFLFLSHDFLVETISDFLSEGK